MSNPAPTVEAFAPSEIVFEEEYARSMSSLREMGRLITESEVELDFSRDGIFEPHQDDPSGAEQISFDNYTSGLREMLKTDEVHGKKLKFEDPRIHDIVDGQVVAADGKPMVDLVRAGLKKSIKLANGEKPEFKAQAEMDYGQVLVTERVDQLEPGQTLFALSMVPEREMVEQRATYTGLGYRDGLSILQVYSRTEDQIVALSVSIDNNDVKAWREVFGRLGVDIPEDESPTTWIQNTFVREMGPEQAIEYSELIQQDFNRTAGIDESSDPDMVAEADKQSVTEFLAENHQTVKQYFDYYYPPLAVAIHTGKNNDRIKSLAQSFLSVDLQNMKPETRQQIMTIANSDNFDQELGRTMDDLIRYAVIEHIRTQLGGFLNKSQANTNVHFQDKSTDNTYSQSGYIEHENTATRNEIPPDMMNRNLAEGLQSGVKERRSYGGCSQVKLTEDLDGETNLSGPQSAYGGYGNGKSSAEKNGDKIGWGGSPAEKIRCIKCRVYVDRKTVTKDPKAWRCPHCEFSIDVCTGDVKHESKVDAKQRQAEKPAEVVSIMDRIREREEEARRAEQRRKQQQELGKAAVAT